MVTGAGRGIGRAVAASLLTDSYTTVVVARTEKDIVSLKEIGDALPFVGDLTSKNDLLKLTEFCAENNIVPHVLVNNAGAYYQDDIFTPDSQLQKNLDANLIQVRELTALLWDSMKANGNGHVFNIVSVLGKNIRTEAASYTMAKHALAAYNRLLFEEGRKQGIKVTGIFPASVYTSSWEGSGVDADKLIAPSDIVQLIRACLALSPAAVPDEIHLQCMDKNF